MTTTTPKKSVVAPPSEDPPADDIVEAPPAVGTVRRLDDPDEGGEPVFVLYLTDGYVARLGAARYELPTYPIG